MKKLITCIKVFALSRFITLGIVFVYAFIWFLLDLPVAWWSAAGLAILSTLSAWGLIVWVARD